MVAVLSESFCDASVAETPLSVWNRSTFVEIDAVSGIEGFVQTLEQMLLHTVDVNLISHITSE